MIKIIGNIGGGHQCKDILDISGDCSTLHSSHFQQLILIPMEDKIQVKSATKDGYEEAEPGDSINFYQPNSETRRGRVGKGVAQTLDTQSNQAVIVAMRGRNKDNPSDRTTGIETEQRLEANSKGISNTIRGVGKDNLVMIPKKNYVQWDTTGKGHNSQDQRAFYEDGNCASIGNEGSHSQPKVIITDKKNIKNNGTETKTNPIGLLPTLREEIGEEKIEMWGLRIIDSFQQEEILQPKLYEDCLFPETEKERSEMENGTFPFKEIQERILRDMWKSEEFGCSPQRRELAEQFTKQFANSLPKLPYKGTQGAEDLSDLHGKALLKGILHETLSKMEEVWESPNVQEESISPAYRIRRLTEIEASRLQGFPDQWNEFGNYDGVVKPVPKTQRYKQLGNAVTVDIVRIIGERLIKYCD